MRELRDQFLKIAPKVQLKTMRRISRNTQTSKDKEGAILNSRSKKKCKNSSRIHFQDTTVEKSVTDFFEKGVVYSCTAHFRGNRA